MLLHHHLSSRPPARRVAKQGLKPRLQCSNSKPKTSRQVQAYVFDKFKDLVNQIGSSSTTKQDSTASRIVEEAEEGAELVRIDTESSGGLGGTSEDVFGPLAVLLVGFLPEEYEAFRTMMIDIEADMVKIVPCTRALLSCTLQEAMESEFPQYEQPLLGQRRALFLAGMYGSEVVELIAAYRDAGLPPCAFAAAVPNNWRRTVQELSEAVWRDHAAMMAKQQQSGAVEDSY